MKLNLFTKTKKEEKKPEAKPPDFRQQVDDLLEGARGSGAVQLWEVSYTTPLDSWVSGELFEGTYFQVLKMAADLKACSYLAIKLCKTPKVLR